MKAASQGRPVSSDRRAAIARATSDGAGLRNDPCAASRMAGAGLWDSASQAISTVRSETAGSVPKGSAMRQPVPPAAESWRGRFVRVNQPPAMKSG